MQLLSMEVERQSGGDRAQVSAIGPGLNAVCGRRGSGKTTLLRWLRAALTPNSLIGQRIPELAAGRLELRDHDRQWLVMRDARGAPVRKQLLRESSIAWNVRGNSNGHLASRDDLSSLACAAIDHLAAIPSGPEAIDRLWEAARALKIDNGTELNLGVERERLVSRERDLTAELHTLEGLAATREGLLARRRSLEAELDRVRREFRTLRPGQLDSDERRRLEQRLANYQTESQTVRDEIAELEAAIARLRNEILAIETQGQNAQTTTPRSYRERLTELDAQLARWRTTLAELRSHRERLETSATDAQLNRQLGEQLAPIAHADPRIALRGLEAQIAEARRNFDQILEGFDRQRAEYHEGRHDMPSTLRVMQKELHEICQQLSRHESQSVGRELREQTLQLSRAESELRLSIERLISERGELLREIATAYQLSVDQVSIAYDASCRCADHPKLEDWLLTQRISAVGQLPFFDGSNYQTSVDELARLEQRHKQALAQLEEIQRHYRDMDARLRRLGHTPDLTFVRGRSETDVMRDLDAVDDEARRLETRDRLRVELSDVRRQLERLASHVEDAQSLRAIFRRNWQALGGDSPVVSSLFSGRSDSLASGHSAIAHRLNGSHDPVHYATLQEVALRLAIAQRLASVGAAIPVLFDETLDLLPAQLRQLAVRHLAQAVTVSGQSATQQILVMTESDAVVGNIRDEHGSIVPVVHVRAHRDPAPVTKPDVNRQLLAFANDFESDKWNEPEWASPAPPVPQQEPTAKRKFVLTERSPAEDVPSIDRTTAARLRLLGVQRVENLLDSDAVSLANELNLEGVSAGTVQAWQAEARLLVANPQLRPFDARVLVGAGVHYPRQLADLHPSHLHDRVERFLATDRGRQIMRSGSSYELSRLTAWLASAKSGVAAVHAHDDQESDHSSLQTHSEFASPRVPRPSRPDADRQQGLRSSRSEQESAPMAFARETKSTLPISDRSRSVTAGSTKEFNDRRRPQGSRKRRNRQDGNSNVASVHSATGASESQGWKFHLELASPVVDAPSIGERMAEQLQQLGIETVEELLGCDADSTAQELGNRRVSAQTVRAWQDQARLVCRVPNLRGHDAQMLVACDVTTPEALARMQAGPLLSQVVALARSADGQRILRGSQEPDVDEVQNWIKWANNSRTILAA